MLVSRVAILVSILTKSRQCASQRVGFVLVLLIMFRLGLTHTRLNGLRAANPSLPVVVLSVASVFLSPCLLCFVHLPRVSRQALSFGLAWRVGGCSGFCFLFSPLFFLCFLPAVNLCVRRGSCLLFFLSVVKHLVRPLVFPSLSFACVCVWRPV